MPKPLRASEVLALEAGGVLSENLAHEIDVAGLRFRPDDEFLGQMKQAGADARVWAALQSAKIKANEEAKPDKPLLQKLAHAAILMRDGRYNEAAAALENAITLSFASDESGFVMGQLLCKERAWPKAAAVYEEILRRNSDFPEVHTKLSFVLYALGDSQGSLREAKVALGRNPQDPEAHKNAALALSRLGNSEAAVAEFRQALADKPDYAAVHYDLGILFQDQQDYDNAVAEYKKAIALAPNQADYHTNLGNVYHQQGKLASAIYEQREAKRLNPNDPVIRQNLASALMTREPYAAIAELRELEKLFPDFEVCHICLGRGLVATGDLNGAEAEFRRAAELDPSDSDSHSGLGSIEEKKKNYDAALEQYRLAEKLGQGDAHTHADVGRVLLEKQDTAGALSELKTAELLSPGDWSIHDLYGQAWQAAGDNERAITQFKQAISLDPTQSQVVVKLASALEAKGDWVSALEILRKAALSEESANSKHQIGETFYDSKEAKNAYAAAQQSFNKYLAKLMAEGKAAEATNLRNRVQATQSSPGLLEQVQLLMQSSDQAFKEERFADAEKGYKEAVRLAEHLPPQHEDLIVALTGLARAYAQRRDFADAEATLNRQISVIEKALGPNSMRMTDPLTGLGRLAVISEKNYGAAEGYYSRALEINLNLFGENSPRTEESLRAMAGLYMIQSAWAKAEPYLLRAVKSEEAMNGPDDPAVLIPLWGLCDLYDRWNKPEESQPCWHRATGLLEKQSGENSPDLVEPIGSEAKALRQLGRNTEADHLEERVETLQHTTQKN